jgi:dipeptidyl aminopeptidase/acylaminoacyl peptidase
MRDVQGRPVQVDDLADIKTVSDVQLSPDGSRVAYTLTEMVLGEDRYRSTIWVASTRGGNALPFTRGATRDVAPRWSPTGHALAFLSDRDGDRPQLYLIPAGGGEPRKLTALDHEAGAPVWSPDGSQIAFSARVPTARQPFDRQAQARWTERPKVVTRAHYKSDGSGYTLDAVGRLFVLSLASGVAVEITNGDSDDVAPAWSPDGARLAFCRERGGIGDYHVFDLWVCRRDGGDPRRLTTGVGRAMSPAWSPDGEMIACYGADEQEPGLGESLTRVWIVPVSGGAARRLTAGYDRGVALLPRPVTTPGPVWSPDSRTVTFVAADAGSAHVVRADLATGSVREIVGGERQVQSASAVAAADVMAFIATSPHVPSDVYVCRWDGSHERRLTQVNDHLLSQLVLPRVERRSFDGAEGEAVDGWLIRPAAGDGPSPLLVDIHGGPQSFHGNVFPLGTFHWYVLASRGWSVLALNPTGSGSYGKAFAHGIRGAWGERDLPEQLRAVDALVAEGIADGRRLAVAGYSYGGYMTAWTITHTDRFKAAVVGAPVVNLESFHGTSDIGMWFASWEMRGDIVGQRETYRRLSPINYVDRVTTPTLVVHGEADDRCPIGQGEELFIGVLAAGRVPTELVRYPGASHMFRSTGRPSHRLDVNRRTIAWLERHTLEAVRPPAR